MPPVVSSIDNPQKSKAPKLGLFFQLDENSYNAANTLIITTLARMKDWHNKPILK